MIKRSGKIFTGRQRRYEGKYGVMKKQAEKKRINYDDEGCRFSFFASTPEKHPKKVA